MYDPDETTAISRSDLRPPSSSPDPVSSTADIREQWHRQLAKVYSNGSEAQHTPELTDGAAQPAKSAPDQSDEDAYDFRLFSGRKHSAQASGQQTTKVRIESPNPASKEPGFVRPSRPENCYFTGAGADVDRKKYEEAAVEGEWVLKEAQARWPGFEQQWRLTTIAAPRPPKQAAPIAGASQVSSSGKRKRSGKKRRIAIRIRTRTQKERDDVLKKAEVEREVAEREKRNRRNREKKIKRREKARAEKKVGDGKNDRHGSDQMEAL